MEEDVRRESDGVFVLKALKYRRFGNVCIIICQHNLKTFVLRREL